MNESTISWISVIMTALKAILPDVSSTDSNWIKPDDFYELKASAGEDFEAIENQWVRLDGHHWKSPKIKWIKDTQPSNRY